MKRLIAAALLAAGPAAADDYMTMEAQGTVAEAADRLVAAIEEAGAMVVARVDHQANAASADMELPPATKVIFGNPKLGTPVMQQDIRAAFHLPQMMLIYEDAEGRVHVMWQEPGETFDDLGVDAESEAVTRMRGALETLAGAAAGG